MITCPLFITVHAWSLKIEALLKLKKDVLILLTVSQIGALALGRFPSPEPGARRGWRFSIIVTAWWVGCALRCPQARLPPHPARAQTGVGGGGGGSSRVWRCVLKI